MERFDSCKVRIYKLGLNFVDLIKLRSMKNIILFVSFFYLFSSAKAQPVTAQNWTKTDCAGIPHTLFSYLDNHEVAVMLFEMGCGGCAAGGKVLEGIKQFFDFSNPGKVHFFALDYWVGQTCATDVVPFLADNNLSYPGFDHCLSEKNYYTSQSPMPMIVVAADTSHSLYYFSISYIPGDSIQIFQAIDSALSVMNASGINKFGESNMIKLFPNPAGNESFVSFDLANEAVVRIELLTIFGEKISLITNENMNAGKHKISIQTQHLSKGLYFLNIAIGSNSQQTKLVLY